MAWLVRRAKVVSRAVRRRRASSAASVTMIARSTRSLTRVLAIAPAAYEVNDNSGSGGLERAVY